MKIRKGSVEKKCKICDGLFHCKQSESLRAKYCSRLCASKSFIGKKPWNFGKGTISSQNELVRKSKEYILWRQAIFERDNFICIFCGQKGGRLNADHIKPFAYFPELRFAIDNGRTLCELCHRNTDTYGWGLYHKNKKQNGK